MGTVPPGMHRMDGGPIGCVFEEAERFVVPGVIGLKICICRDRVRTNYFGIFLKRGHWNVPGMTYLARENRAVRHGRRSMFKIGD